MFQPQNKILYRLSRDDLMPSLYIRGLHDCLSIIYKNAFVFIVDGFQVCFSS